MKILKKFFIFILIFNLLFVPNNFSFSIDDSVLKLQQSMDKLKSGEQHVIVTNIKDEPMYYFELFRYTALDDIIPSLNFEKNPCEVVKSKYEKIFKVINNCCATVGSVVGARLGLIFNNGLISKKDFNKNEGKPDPIIKVKNLFLSVLVVLANTFTFSALMNFISNFYSNSFMAKELKKLYVGKDNALLAIKCLLTNINHKNWEHGDSVLLQVNSSLNHPTAVPTIIKSGINYSNEESENFPEAFENLKKNLEEILKQS